MKCTQCGKKLQTGLEFQCKCLDYFCIKHLVGYTHSCTFDYKKEHQQILEKRMPVISPHMDRI